MIRSRKLYIYFSWLWQSQSELCPSMPPDRKSYRASRSVSGQTLLGFKQINKQKMIPLHYVTDLNRVNNQKKVFFEISRFFCKAHDFFCWLSRFLTFRDWQVWHVQKFTFLLMRIKKTPKIDLKEPDNINNHNKVSNHQVMDYLLIMTSMVLLRYFWWKIFKNASKSSST